MEPMTLGSPVGSPVSGGGSNNQYHHYGHGFSNPNGFNPNNLSQHSQFQPVGGTGAVAATTPTTPGTGFLPGFLMGDPQGAGRMVSPTKLNRSLSQTGGGGGTHLVGTPGTPVPSGQRINGFLTPTTPAGPGTPGHGGSSLRNGGSNDKPGGPPTKGLFSTPTHSQHLSRVLDNQVSTSPMAGTPGTPRAQMNCTPMPSTPQLSFGSAAGTPKLFNNTLDSSLSSHGEGGNTTWVTVFGFPPSAASYILKQFSQCGTVLQHHVPVNGNWMHIRYQTRTQAASALGRSGRVLSGTLMIGVVLTADAEVAALSNGQATSNGGLLDQSGSGSKANISTTTVNTSISGTPNRSIRPLAQAYKAAQSEHELSMSSTTTTKNDGIVSKAMGCIFGW